MNGWFPDKDLTNRHIFAGGRLVFFHCYDE